MSTANSDISAALDSALNGEADPQAADTQSTEVATNDIVAQAVADALKSQSPAASDESATEKGSKEDPKAVPYDRFSEVVGQKNSAVERLNALDEQFKATTERENTLKTRVGELEQEHQVLEAIRGLAKDDRYSDAVNKIDRALQGLEDEVVQAEASGDQQAVSAAEKRFEAKSDELTEMITDQKAEQLFDKANNYASEMLRSLPEEYTDVDKARLGQMWSPRVDWNSIEEGGEAAIPDTMKGSFAELIKSYGTPQGAVASETRTQVESEISPEALEQRLSPEDMVKGIVEKDWAETAEGKSVHSDDEFSADMAKLLRATNAGR
jgi:hypothetical protein